MNKVFLAGYLTRDPELRRTGSGTAVANMGMGVTETYTNKNGEKVETTCFSEVTAWGRIAEACDKYLSKGSAVLVDGRLETDAWETEKGEKRSRLKVRADRVQFLGDGRKSTGNGGDDRDRSRRSDRSSEALEEAGL
jgi:single-strand DNA-binding protein